MGGAVDGADEAETLVFVNYRSSDGASSAELVYAEMVDRFGPDAVFLDHESLRLGRDFEPDLLARLRGSAVLLVVVGDRWLDGEVGQRPIDSPDDWVRREILEAVEHGVPVVPVLFPGARLDADRLPAELRGLTKYQYHQIHRLQRSDVRELGERLISQIPRLADRQAVRSDDLRALGEVTEANLGVLEVHAALPTPSGQVKIPRSDLAAVAEVDGDFIVSGEPGCGKSGLLFELAQHLREQGEDVVLLTVDSLGSQPGAIRDDVLLSQPLVKVLAQWPGERRATLLVDGLDAARGEGLRWLANLVTELRPTRWRTVASMRRFDLRYSRLWKLTFTGSPVSDDLVRRHQDLAQVRHYWLGNLAAEQLTTVAACEPVIAQLVDKADDRFLGLLRNPFNLRLACELLRAGTDGMSLSGTRDQLELLQRYWCARVIEQSDGEARQRVLGRISRVMLNQRILRASGDVIPDPLLDVRNRLVSDGVLNEVPSRLRASGPSPLVFSHHILFDYAVAALVLARDGESRLTDALDADANLVLVACPSIDLHLADLWHADPSRALFAEVLTALARRGCSIAGVAAARVVIREAADADDLAWLHVMADEGHNVDVPVLGWLTGAMEAAEEPVRQRVRDTIEPWLKVVAASAARLSYDFHNARAQQAMRMLWQLDHLEAMEPCAAGASTWADSVAALMGVILAEPESRAGLGSRLARFLPRTVAIHPAHAPLLRRTLTPEVVKTWPSNYLLHYVNEIDTIASGDPKTARDVLIAVLTFDDDSNDITVITEGVLTLTSTRRQDVDGLKYAVGRHMPAFITKAGMNHATPVLASALQIRELALPDDVPSYPICTPTVEGHIDVYAPSLEFGPGHGVAEEIVKAFAEALQNLEPGTADLPALIDDLVASIHHPEAWSHLLTAAAQRPAELGSAVLPTLLTGGLLAHPDTRAAAGRLIETLSPMLSSADHEVLEHAILNAPKLLDDPTSEQANRLLDQLISRLDIDRIHDPEIASRAQALAERGERPDIFEPSKPEAFYEPDTLRDHLGEQEHDRLSPEERDAIEVLRSAVDATAGNATPDQVPVLEQALRDVLNAGLADPDRSQPIRLLIVRAIDILVRGSHPDPSSELATLIMPILLDAARGTDEQGEEEAT